MTKVTKSPEMSSLQPTNNTQFNPGYVQEDGRRRLLRDHSPFEDWYEQRSHTTHGWADGWVGP